MTQFAKREARADSEARRSPGRGGPGATAEGRLQALALAFSIAIAAGGLLWASIDTRPQPILDEYVHKTIALADGLANRPLTDLPILLYRATIGPRLPAYQAAGALFVATVDRSADGMLIANALAIVLLGFATFRAGTLVGGAATGLMATICVLTYPLTLNLAKLARAHSILPSVAALVVWVLLENAWRPTAAKAWALSLSLLLVFAVHASGLYSLAGPTMLALILALAVSGPSPRDWTLGSIADLLKLRARTSYVTRGLIPAFGLLLLVFGIWIRLKRHQFVGLVDVSQKLFAGQEGSFYYLETLPLAISPFSTWAFLLASGALVVLSVKRPEASRLSWLILLSPPLMFLGANSMFGGKRWDLFCGVLPALAIVTAAGGVGIARGIAVSRVSTGVKRALGMFALIGGGAGLAVNYSITVWGVPRSEAVLRLVGSDERQQGRRFFYPDPPVPGDWQIEAIARRIAADAACRPGPCSVAMLSRRFDYFHEEALHYYALIENPGASLLVMRPGSSEHGVASWIRSDYVIFLQGPRRPLDPGRVVRKTDDEASVALVRDLSSEATGLERVLVGRLPTDEEVVLLRRTRQLTEGEVRALVGELIGRNARRRVGIDGKEVASP